MITDFEKDLDNRVSITPHYETGLVDNVVAGFGATRREELPITSRWIADTSADQEGERVLLDALDKGQISQSVASQFTNPLNGKVDVEGALNYLKRAGISNEYDPEEYVKERDAEYESLRNDDQEVFDRSNRLGSIGEFVGRMGATFTDPVYLATLPLGIGPANTVLSAAARTAALNAGIEAFAVPFIWDFKKRIGADYGMEDAVAHLGTAAAGGFILGGAGKALGKLFKQSKMTMKGLEEGDIAGSSKVSTALQDAKLHNDPVAVVAEGAPDPVLAKGEELIAKHERAAIAPEQAKMPALEAVERTQIKDWMQQGQFIPPEMLEKYPDILPEGEILARPSEKAVKVGQVVGTEQIAEPAQMTDDFLSIRRERIATARKTADKELMVVENDIKAKRTEIDNLQKEVDDITATRDKKRDARKELRKLKKQLKAETDPKAQKKLKKAIKKAARVRTVDLNVEKQTKAVQKLEEEIVTLETDTLPLKQSTVDRLGEQSKTLKAEAQAQAKATEVVGTEQVPGLAESVAYKEYQAIETDRSAFEQALAQEVCK